MRRFTFLAAFICLVAPCLQSSAAVKVFLLAGQSNMQGMGGYTGWVSGYSADDACPSPYDATQTTVNFWDYGTPADGLNAPEVDGDHWDSLQPTYGYKSGEFGPEVSFGYKLRQMYPDDQIYLVKYAKGSTVLATDWKTDGAGACYNYLKNRTAAAMKNLADVGLSPTLAGMIWMQGEGDAKTTANANAYQTNLTNFIATVRSTAFSEYAHEDMPFALGQIHEYYLERVGGETVRNAQAAVADSVDHVSMVHTDDLTEAYAGHFGTESQIELGTRFAEAVTSAPEPSTCGLTLITAACVLAYWRGQRFLGL